MSLSCKSKKFVIPYAFVFLIWEFSALGLTITPTKRKQVYSPLPTPTPALAALPAPSPVAVKNLDATAPLHSEKPLAQKLGTVTVVLPKEEEPVVSGLKIHPLSAPAEFSGGTEEETKTFFRFRGFYKKPYWKIFLNGKPLPIRASGNFEIPVILTTKVTEMKFSTKGPYGESETEKVELHYSHWKNLSALGKRHFFQVGSGLSYILYSESGVASRTHISLTGKIAYSYKLKPRLDLGFSSYFTLLPLMKSPAGDMRFLGINGRIGYTLGNEASSWKFTIALGGYYTTMFVENDAFGFRNMMGPQIFPVLRKERKNRHSIATYIKFSPVSQGTFNFTFQGNEFAFGGAYSIPLPKTKLFSITLDIASLKLLIDSVAISSQSLTLGASYGF